MAQTLNDLGQHNVYNTIKSVKEMVESDQFPSELREVLKTTLMIIKILQSENDVYKEKVSLGGKVKDIYRGRGKVEDNELVNLTLKVQDYLATVMSEQYNNADKDDEDAESIRKAIVNYIKSNSVKIETFDDEKKTMRLMTEDELCEYLMVEIRGFSVLQEAFEGPNAESIEEIQVNDYNDIRFIVGGEEQRTNLEFRSPEHVRLFADRLTRVAGLTGDAKTLSKENPFVRLRVGDTTRVSMMGEPFARRGSGIVQGEVIQMAIRKQRSKPFDRNFLLSKNSIDPYGDNLIATLVSTGVSINAYGGTGTGKTAMLRRYLSEIPNHRKTITLAEIDEMNLRQVDMRKYIVDKDTGLDIPNPDLHRAINSALMWECPDMEKVVHGKLKGFAGLVNACLTFTPETIVLQESKSGEIKDVIEAAISGHQVFTTIHANSPEAFFLRILLMYQQAAANISDSLILQQIPLAFPVIMCFKRYPDGSRKIAEVTELLGYDTIRNKPITNTLLKYVHEGTYFDPNLGPKGKLVMKGRHYAGKKFLSEKTISVMRDGGLEDSVFQALKTEWNNSIKRDFSAC